MKNDNVNLLLDDFQGCSYDQWKIAAEQLLKGAPFDKKMLTRTAEGITLQPIYFPDRLDSLPQSDSAPGGEDYVRGVDSDGYLNKGWDIAQETGDGAADVFNETLMSGLTRGQTALNAVLDSATQDGLDPVDAVSGDVAVKGLSLSCLEDFATAVDGIYADAIPLNFQSGTSGLVVESMLLAWLESKKIPVASIKGSINMDPLGTLTQKGKLPSSLGQLFDEMAAIAKYNAAEAPALKAVGVSGMPYHVSGASAVEELAIVLGTGLQYVRALTQRGLTVDEAAEQIRFTFSVGGDFFMELCKIRAARLLWARVVKELGGGANAQKMRIHARTGTYNKTVCDPYVNMLRTTTEALSAVVGGVDSLSVGLFDEIVRDSAEFSSRIARNTQIILQEECELTQVIDAGGGSWYIESLTNEVAEKAWSIFKDLEAEGGVSACLESGYIQKMVIKTRGAREALLGKRISSLVGTNQYPNLTETPLEVEPVDADLVRKQRVDFLASKSGDCSAVSASSEKGTLVDAVKTALASGATIGKIYTELRSTGKEAVAVEALPSRRLATCYEELRNAGDAYKAKKGHGPKIFLLTLGALKRHKARADFSKAFFEAGGFEVSVAPGYEDEASALAGVKESGAEIVVICGRDDDYEAKLVGMLKALKGANSDITAILAGFPGENEATYKEAGLDDFIFVKTNNYETNLSYLKKLGAL